MASLNEYQSLSAAPSVSNEQWKKHALKKLSSGSLMIICTTRKFSRFYKVNGELENCSFPIARRLLREGYLEEIGTHITGTIYQLGEFAKDQVSLAKISQSKMGARPIFEDEDLEEDDTSDFAYDEADEALAEEIVESDSEDGDRNPMAA